MPQCSEAAGKFHVQALTFLDSGGPGGKGASAPMRHVWNAHVSGAAHQAPLDGKMRQEYADEVEEMGCGDIGKVCGCNLKPHVG